MKRHWYKITVYACPLCGRGDSIRERQYIPKPKDAGKRYFYLDRYDYCDL